MQLMISDHAAKSIATAAHDLQQRLLRESGEEYSIESIEKILLACLGSVVDDWSLDCYEHCTRPQPYGWSQTEFNRQLSKVTPCR